MDEARREQPRNMNVEAGIHNAHRLSEDHKFRNFYSYGGSKSRRVHRSSASVAWRCSQRWARATVHGVSAQFNQQSLEGRQASAHYQESELVCIPEITQRAGTLIYFFDSHSS